MNNEISSDSDAMHQDSSKNDYEFGNWPEVFGLLLTIIILYLSFAFRG